MHHEAVLQLLQSVSIDCPPAVSHCYFGIVLKVSDIPMHHEAVLQLLLSVFIDCPPAVSHSYFGIVLKVSDIPMHHEAVLQLLLSVFIDCPPAVGLSYLRIVLKVSDIPMLHEAVLQLLLPVLQLSAVLTTWALQQLSAVLSRDWAIVVSSSSHEAELFSGCTDLLGYYSKKIAILSKPIFTLDLC
jgi:hypothetical protein